MAGRFGHLREIANGDKGAVVPVSLHDYTPPRQRGWLAEGRYAFDVVDGDWSRAQSGQGVNLHLLLRSALPAECAGVPIEDWTYVPFDDIEGDSKIEQLSEIAYSKLQHIMRSLASADPGKVEALKLVGADGKPKFAGIGPKSVVGKRLFAEVEAGEADVIGRDGRTRDFSNTSKVKWYIGREDFEAQPGPSKARTTSAKQQGAAPELRGQRQQGNGAGAQAAQAPAAGQASVDSLVDF